MERQTLYFDGPRRVTVRSEYMERPSARQVLVQTLVSAISPGTEMLLYRNQLPPGLAVDETIDSLSGSFGYPMPYGYACVGRVIAVGTAVPATWQDRLVFAFQPHQSHFLAEPEALHLLPPQMSPETAVMLPNMETAVSFVMDGQPLIGERVVVFGQGIVGLLTMALLAQFPLAACITVDAYALRRRWSQRLGATHTVDPATAALPADADLCFELSGNPTALAAALDVAGYQGRIVVGSWYGNKPVSLPLGHEFHRRQLRLISSQVSHIAPQWRGRWHKARRLETAWTMLAHVQPERLITHRFPLTQAAAAYQLLDEAPETAVQVLFTYET